MWVHERLENTVDRHAERPALRTRDRTWSYAELDARARSVAEQLVDAGVGPGQRVAIDLGSRAEAVAAIWATLRAGAAFVCLDPGMPAAKLSYVLSDLEPAVWLTRSRRLATGVHVPPGCRVMLGNGDRGSTLGFDLELPPRHDLLEPPGEDDSALANLVYTSGSTGRPKGVMMSHRAVGAAMRSIAGYLRLEGTDVVLDLLPLGFDYGLYQVLLCAEVGAELVLEENAAFPGSVLETLREASVTTLPLVPSLLHMLLERPSFRQDELPRLRRFTNTGARMPEADLRELRRRFPDALVFLMYGLTECKRVSYLPPEFVDRHPDSVGIPMPGCEVAIVDAQGNPVAANEEGELVVRGDNLMSGYWRNPEATARALRPGPWGDEPCLWSGDRFRRDPQGLLYFAGRRDEVFKSRGEKVAPIEVEEALLEVAPILEVAVVPAEDPRLGARIHAFLVTTDAQAAEPPELRRRLALRLEPHKIPHEFHFVKDLPRNERGKVDRAALLVELEESPTGGEHP